MLKKTCGKTSDDIHGAEVLPGKKMNEKRMEIAEKRMQHWMSGMKRA